MHCKHCNTTKTADDFYAANKTRCKACVRAAAAANRTANLERVRAYDRLRGAQPHRVAARKEYQQTQQGRDMHQRALAASNERYPERNAARIKLGNAIRDGKVKPWPVCAVHTCAGKPEGHHADYSAPLLVTWLCNAHHRAAHALTRHID